MSGELVLGPFTVGIDHVSPDTKLPKGAVHDAVNGDFNRAGEFESRAGSTLALAAAGLHSLWSSPATGIAFCGQGSTLCTVRESDGGALVLDSLVNVGEDSPISFDDLNSLVLFANANMVGAIKNGVVQELAPPTPSLPAVTASINGALAAGRYGVGVSFVGESESALSALEFVDVPEGGGLQFQFTSSSYARRIYRTGQNGDGLYLAAEIPGVLTSYMVGHGAVGRLSETRHLAPLPGGQFIRAWNGRVLVARGNELLFSEPMRYGLYSPREGFVQFAQRITMMEPVQSGVFVGTSTGVVFLQGTKPSEFVFNETSALPPFEGSGAVVPASVFGGEVGASGNKVATWLAPNGFVIGSSSGQVIEPQNGRIAIPPTGPTKARTFINDRRLTSILQ